MSTALDEDVIDLNLNPFEKFNLAIEQFPSVLLRKDQALELSDLQEKEFDYLVNEGIIKVFELDNEDYYLRSTCIFY